MSPEEKARLEIDKKLEAAGWVIQDLSDINIHASLGVAVREFQTTDGHEVDYALFVDGTPVGLIEAKEDNKGVGLTNDAHEQNMGYVKTGLKNYEDEKDELRFIYEATSILTRFTDLKDPEPCTRDIFSFHRPETLENLINEYNREETTLRGRLRNFPELPIKGFRECQINAIVNLEESLGYNHQRALVQMATGAGKTYTAITNCYRLLKNAKAKRILFLVDTKQLGEQAETEYKNYLPYDAKDKLASLYNITRIQTSNISSETQICISTIQRLYSMLSGDIENIPDDIDEDDSYITTRPKREVQYNAEYPPEFFDIIIIDECHRSIYNVWRQVLEYFDAFLIGLTATPSKDTYAFFNQNIVSEYTHEQAVDDGVNVGALGTYYIETEITTHGGKVEPNFDRQIEIRDKRTRKQRWETSEDDLEYKASDLDKKVINKSQIRTVITAFRDNWQKWEHFKMREELPKTLIFAKDDSHADDIVAIVKDVFGKGNDFCKKITYKSTEEDEGLLYQFRNDYNPRIAVTVNKIATGTDVKAIEILVFMRDIRSENYYEQMLGRARRTMSEEELKQCSPTAPSQKLGYVIVDAVGVTRSEKTQGKKKCGGDSKPSVGFKALINGIAQGDISDDTLSTAGTRLEHLHKVMTDNEREKFKQLSEGIELRIIAALLKRVYNEDEVLTEIYNQHPTFDELPEDEQNKVRKKVIKERARIATKPICKKDVREFLFKLSNSNDQTIDPAIDKILSLGFASDVEESKEKRRKTFRDFLDKYRDEITALQIIYNQDYRNRIITEENINELYEKMIEYNSNLRKELLFSAYADMTKKNSTLQQLIDIIQIIKYEWKMIPEIYPFAEHVRKNYKDWIFQRNQNKQGARGAGSEPFTAEQLQWLELIRDYISVNASFPMSALQYGEFNNMGGGQKFYMLFREQGEVIVREMNSKLVA